VSGSWLGAAVRAVIGRHRQVKAFFIACCDTQAMAPRDRRDAPRLRQDLG
jgi:hypothetical protein